MKKYGSLISNLKLNRSVKLVILFIVFQHYAFSATLYFNTVWKGTISSASINSISSAPGSGFQFTSANPSDLIFVANGNDVGGVLSYLNSANEVVSIPGVISRQNKTGSITNGLYFYPNPSTGFAFILVIPGRESQFVAGNSYGSSSDTGNTVDAMNATLSYQQQQAVIHVDPASKMENEEFITFRIYFSNNASRTGSSTFPIILNSETAIIGTDVLSSFQTSFDQVNWVNYVTSTTITTNDPQMWVRLTIVDDTLKECDETFTLELGPISGGSILNNAGTYARGFIVDVENYCIWEGTYSTDWNLASNWKCNDPATIGKNVLISAQALNHLDVNDTKTIGYLRFQGADKLVRLNQNDLILNWIEGGNSTNYCQTNGSGKIVSTISALNNKQFHVGRTRYNPVRITNNNLNSDSFSVRVIDTVYLNGLSGPQIVTPHVGVTWDIHKNNPNEINGVDFEFSWENVQEVGIMDGYRVNHHNASNWELAIGNSQNPILTNGAKSLLHTSYSGTFSPFTIGESGTVMPVEFLNLQVECLTSGVFVYWQTASEFNSDYFLLERSRDGSSWEFLAQIPAAGTTNQISNYQFELPTFPYVSEYIRLSQFDYNGAFSLLKTVSLNCQDNHEFILFPNPAVDVCLVQFHNTGNIEMKIHVIDVLGRPIKLIDYKPVHGFNEISLDVKDWSNGMYLIKVIYNETYRESFTFLKE